MNKYNFLVWLLFLVSMQGISGQTTVIKAPVPMVEDSLFIRIAEIEIFPEHLQAYTTILKEEAAASIKAEPGVVAIFPMYQLESPNQVRILEIYANKVAYQSHLQTPHFQHYKTSTLKMVKSLKLVEMRSIDKNSMAEMFKKMK